MLKDTERNPIMQLTRYTDYSLRTLLYLHSLDNDKTVTINEVADFYNISRNHLMKVAYNLSQKGYVKSIRGKGGGIKLARPGSEITVGQVVRDMEPNLHVAECFDQDAKTPCTIISNCALIPVLHEATNLFMSALDRYTLETLMQNKPEWMPIVIKPSKS